MGADVRPPLNITAIQANADWLAACRRKGIRFSLTNDAAKIRQVGSVVYDGSGSINEFCGRVTRFTGTGPRRFVDADKLVADLLPRYCPLTIETVQAWIHGVATVAEVNGAQAELDEIFAANAPHRNRKS